jgi:DNA-binding protein HU-beta
MKDKITKSKFTEELAAVLGITYSEAERYLNAHFHLIYEYLRDGKTVQLSGFGTFSVSHRKARMGINPQTRKPLELPALTVFKFVAGEGAKAAVKLRN